MNILSKLEYNLESLEKLAVKFAKKSKVGDLILLKGDLGVGKTTFARLYINALHDLNHLKKPNNIKSPSFPILINYDFLNYEIHHYDFYRVIKTNELIELSFFEQLRKKISIVEWPEIILDNFNLKQFYLFKFDFIDGDKRSIEIKYKKK